MFAHCKGPLWRLDDFSECFEKDYLQTLFPLVICAVSLLYLVVQLFQEAKASKYYHAYTVLADPTQPWSIHSPHYDNGEEVDSSEDELERNEQLALQPSVSRQTASTMVPTRPRGQITIVVLEELAVLAALGVQVTEFFTGTHGHKDSIAAITGIVVWVYIATLASLRLLSSSTSKLSFPRLWYHTAFIYGFQWILTLLVFRSAIIHPRSPLQQRLTIAGFALNSVLLIIALSSRKGNKAVELEYEGDILPSREPTASVFSLATWSWVDSIVWTGYKKTYELSDVWNLAPQDKAAAVISQYRQVKKTSSLGFHLLKHFKRSLLIQGGWAALSGVVAFAPTLLLKAILEYVEAPEYTPKNAAWFYVTLLFCSGCLSALADGHALWIGRKVCIRLRAIVIGEIYAKALKRRAAAGADKVLGEEKKVKKSEDETEPSKIKRMMTFGRKKKKTSQADQAQQENEQSPADSQVTTGAIINLMAVDAFKVSEICAYLHFLWANTPVMIIGAVGLLYTILGYSSIAGIGMMFLLLPVNLYVSKQFSSIQKLILAATDARIHTTNEVLTNIRIIKYFAWEQRFIGQVNEKRYTELKNLRKRYLLWAIAATIWSGTPILITFLSFLVYTQVEKRDLVPSVAFTALSLFQILRIPLDQLADMVAHVQESKVSVDRIEEYLNEPETDKYAQLVTHKKDAEGQPLIGFENGTFSWGGTDMNDKAAADAFKLMDLNLCFKVGELNVIVGPTGSGKTSLLMALLGEMTKLKGDVYLPGGRSREDLKLDPETGLTESVAYCAQQAWLINGTVKDNIVFASHFNEKRYKDVIDACSLKRDLEILDAGDETLVGEKGVTLSGGQKQRISLARALYSKARHVLLDDVLSAVDSHTAKWIFDKALMGPLMHNRTCILVTHNVSLCLPEAGFAAVLENGRVLAQGTATEVIDSGKLIEDLSKSRPVSRGASRVASKVKIPGDQAEETDHANDHTNGSANGLADPKKTPASNTQEETKAEGGVKLSIILMYLRAMGPWYYWVGAAISFAAQQVSSVSTNVWIRYWANAYADKNVQIRGVYHKSPVTHAPTFSGVGTCLTSGTCSWNVPFFNQGLPVQHQYSYGSMQQTSFAQSNTKVDSTYYLTVYAILGVIFMIITFVREGFLFAGSLAASRKIHERLIQAITHAKFRFFDQTPLGQLMNRFSKDIESVDQEVAPVAIGVVHCLASIITIVILISVITPGFLIAGFFITVLYALIGMFYLNSSRDLKRLESVHRSPLYQQFGETLSGMTTIRAYGDERRFIRENLTKINTQHRPFIYLWAANRWLAFRVDVVGALVSFFAGVFVVRNVGRIDAGAAGLALTYAVTFTENVLWFVRLYSANEQNMNSVERVKEYLDVDQEAPAVIPENSPPTNWPSQGAVEFVNYSTRYRPDFDLVLRNVTFKVKPGEKVGVVGRTGAGKSSLALALFRALEAEEGKIIVDDIDVGLIGLEDLRKNIVMVPQDPTLFSGTIRSNLDPFGAFTDEEIFQALREVHLISPSSAATSGAGTPEGPSTPRAIEIPNPTTSSVVADVNGSYSASTVNPSSILANRDWEQGEAPDDTVIIMPSGNTQNNPAGAMDLALNADNKNPFRNLYSPVTESGSNLSQGQRQLLCLARALLKQPKVLLMDEATASIDYATDTKIQETIREINNTTITIAHRLQTIIDYNKVLVLDKGEVIQFGDPWDLIREEGGSFRAMCETSGELESLQTEAQKAWRKRKGSAASE